MLPSASDVVVVGAGNAAFCAALAAAEHGISVLMLERAPEEEFGGDSRFTAGAFRCVYDGVDDLQALMPDLSADEIANTDFGTYTQDKFFDDMGRVTEYRTDPDLCELLVTRSKRKIRTSFEGFSELDSSTRTSPRRKTMPSSRSEVRRNTGNRQ